MRLQNTIKKEIHLQGKGLHTGRDIRLRLRPAPRDTGVIFVRTDKGNTEIKACVSSVSDTTFATTLSSNGVKVGTVEHLLAAFSGLNVDNVYVDLDGPEVPVMDGSAVTFVSLILEAGVAQQAKTITCIRIYKPIAIMEGPSQIAVTPYEGTKITYRLYYTHPAFGEQKMGIDVYRNSFIDELAPARTFGFLSDVEKLRARGLAIGGSLENAIVLGQNEIINKEMLRFKDEFVRHKILDLIGDMSLLGVPIYGHIIANKSGHTMNVKLLKKILLSRDSWEIVSESPVKLSALESIA